MATSKDPKAPTIHTGSKTDVTGVDNREVRDSTAYGGAWFGKAPEREDARPETPTHDLDGDDPTTQVESQEHAPRGGPPAGS